MYLPMILSFLSAFKHFSQSEKHILVIFFFFNVSRRNFKDSLSINLEQNYGKTVISSARSRLWFLNPGGTLERLLQIPVFLLPPLP